MAVATAQHVLSDDILTRCAERAPVYDRENRFFTEDFEELRDAGYLLMNVPEELGGRTSYHLSTSICQISTPFVRPAHDESGSHRSRYAHAA
jgi:alkylation response protein AidB-like acyl-CoA dehydrogenase